jgi:Ulp1 family protease
LEAVTLAGELLKEIGIPLKTLGKGADCVLLELGALKFTVREMRLLSKRNWLSDTICDAYFRLIHERSLRIIGAQFRKVSLLVVGVTIGTCFVTRHKDIMSAKEGNWVNQWADVKTGIGSFLDVDKVLIPMCPRQNHYVLVVVNNIMKRFEFYNSWLEDDFDYQPMFECIRAFMAKQIVKERSVSEWPLSHCEWFCPKPVLGRVAEKGKEIPGQGNLSDCGVFISMFGNYAALDSEMSFTQADIPRCRLEMLYGLLRGSLQWPLDFSAPAH